AAFRLFSRTKNNSADASGISAASTESPEETELAVFETASVKQTVRPVSNDITYTQDELQNISVYDACNGAVVNINTKVTAINWFLEPIVEDGGSGSGSIIDKRGYVLTNVHVIKGATKIYVSLSDGTQYEATVVGQDEDSDLAVIKFTPPEGTVLQTISFGDSTKLKVGQKVIAIGNPFGFDRTMTTGIVSALGRPIKNSSNRIIRNMIQTDSAINPGNSGGPLLDTSGKMIGINTMIYSSSGNSAGVGFAVPAETAVRVASDLLKYGRVRRGVIEVSLVQLNNTIANYANLDIAKGVLVSRATKGGNADAAGIIEGTQAARYGNTIIYLGGDIITKIDNISVTSIADYYSALESKRPGDVVNVTVHRNGKDRTVSIRLADPSYKDKPAATYGI
ncbi:trypsin-like peptidase domain-containing protein, partial [uncultured Treponema sp.]|uniref:S1C family serine protease n=1 Tax=uncultured Treponema sp. TaxID=162155 RepID=UPI0025978681